MENERKVTSVKVNEQLWREVRMNCFITGMKVTDFVEEALKQRLKPVDKSEFYRRKGIKNPYAQ